MFTFIIATYFIINAFFAGMYYGHRIRFADDFFDKIWVIAETFINFLFAIPFIIFVAIWDELIKKGWSKFNLYVPIDGIIYFYFTDKLKNLNPRVLKEANDRFEKENKGKWYNRIAGWLLKKINDRHNYIHGVTPMNPGLGIDEELMNW
jgi:hypothetical protein